MVIIPRGASLRSSPIGRWFYHADLDRLPIIETTYANATDPERQREQIAHFARVLDDVCINAIWKRTMPGRLSRSETALMQVLARTPTLPNVFSWLDVGASDGSTTVDMIDALEQQLSSDIEVRTVIGDRYLRLERYRFGFVSEYRTTGNAPVLVRIGSLGLRLPRSPRRFDWVSSIFAWLYLSCSILRARLHFDTEISLLSPAVKNRHDVSSVEFDLRRSMDELIGRFQFVRASNVLNPAVFDQTELRVAIANLKSYLYDHGRLLISRSTIDPSGESEHGSIWRKLDGALVHELSFGEGSEIRELVA